MQGVLDVGGARRDQHDPASGRTTDVGDRRGVDPDWFSVEARVGEGAFAAQGGAHLRPPRQQLRPEGQRARDDRLFSIEHLDAQLPAGYGRLERLRERRAPPARRR